MVDISIVPVTKYQIIGVVRNRKGVRVQRLVRQYSKAKDAAEFYAYCSTQSWACMQPSCPSGGRWDSYNQRVYRRVLPYFQQFMK